METLSKYHGEYKVPGGKLLVADFNIKDNAFCDFSLTGDFFLEPDHAILDISNSLNGFKVSSSNNQITRHILDSLHENVEFIGFAPDDISIAIKRALNNAKSFKDYSWNIVPHLEFEPNMHMALDEVLTRAVGAGEIGPTLRFWQWKSPAIVIGSFQSVKNEVDIENTKKYNIEVVRRISGGGAMFCEKENVITWSLYIPGEIVGGMDFADSYKYLDAWAVEALKSFGIEAYHQGLNDIASNIGKIGGAAQKRFSNGGILHHVTMSYDIDADKMMEVLRIGREKLSDKGIKSANKRVDPIKSQTGLSRAEVINHMLQYFKSYCPNAGTSDIDQKYINEAKELIKTKFNTKEWLYRLL